MEIIIINQFVNIKKVCCHPSLTMTPSTHNSLPTPPRHPHIPHHLSLPSPLLGYLLLLLDLLPLVLLQLSLSLFQLPFQFHILLSKWWLFLEGFPPVSDLLGTHCEFDGGNCFVVVGRVERTGCDDWSAALSAEWVLKNSGEFGITIWYMFTAIGERVYNISQAGEREVDLLGLLEVVTLHAALTDFLGTC